MATEQVDLSALPKEKAAIVRRLRRLEGQVRGLEKMVVENKPCEDILTQIAAVKSAVDRVAGQLIAGRMEECLTASEGEPEGIEKAMLLLRGYMKHHG